jgi:hypothetical protein
MTRTAAHLQRSPGHPPSMFITKILSALIAPVGLFQRNLVSPRDTLNLVGHLHLSLCERPGHYPFGNVCGRRLITNDIWMLCIQPLRGKSKTEILKERFHALPSVSRRTVAWAS